jgi:hypothetical protein
MSRVGQAVREGGRYREFVQRQRVSDAEAPPERGAQTIERQDTGEGQVMGQEGRQPYCRSLGADSEAGMGTEWCSTDKTTNTFPARRARGSSVQVFARCSELIRLRIDAGCARRGVLLHRGRAIVRSPRQLQAGLWGGRDKKGGQISENLASLGIPQHVVGCIRAKRGRTFAGEGSSRAPVTQAISVVCIWYAHRGAQRNGIYLNNMLHGQNDYSDINQFERGIRCTPRTTRLQLVPWAWLGSSVGRLPTSPFCGSGRRPIGTVLWSVPIARNQSSELESTK